MLHWIALAHCTPPSLKADGPADTCVAWALQFTPKVAWLEDCLVLEVQASARLFGGLERLHALVADGARHHGMTGWAWARTALAACAQARQLHPIEGWGPAPRARLSALPLRSLHEVGRHAHALSRLGCHTVGDVLKLPREGLARRFGDGILRTLDQATGRCPQPLQWLQAPPGFEAQCELPHAQDAAPALITHWRPLLQALARWLQTRHLGVCSLQLGWRHAWRNHDGARDGQHTVRLSSATQEVGRLEHLVAEHLARLTLSAPVSDLTLCSSDFQPVPRANNTLFQECTTAALGHNTRSAADVQARRERWLDWMDRVSVRLGTTGLRRGGLRPDHRIECTQAWQAWPALDTVKSVPPSGPQHGTHPSWLLPTPIRLTLIDAGHARGEQPHYQGPLTLLAGPHRVEAGWWDEAPGALVVRDYYLASSPQAGLLWVFKQRTGPNDAGSPWFLHGFFA